MFVDLSRAVSRLGCSSLRFDLSGRGDSSGNYEDTDLDMMIEDTFAAASFMREKTAVGQVVLCGICSGGNVALGTASLSKEVDGLMLLSTPLFAPQRNELGVGRRSRGRILRDYIVKVFRPAMWYKLCKGMVNFRAVGKVLTSDAESDSKKDSRRNIMNDLQGYAGKALFIYGTNDTESAGAPDYYRSYTAENGIPASFEEVEGSDHNFYTTAWQKALEEKICSWITATFP